MDVSPFDRGNELPSVVVLPPVDITQIETVDNDVAVRVRMQVGEDFETLVYPVDDGAYWRQLLAARATQVGIEPTTTSPSTPTPERVGTGVTADGETVSATADPLLDAWTASGTGGR